jgi:hypothetical protein
MFVKRTLYNIIAPGLIGAIATTLMIGCAQDSNGGGGVLSTRNQNNPPTIGSVSVGGATESSVMIEWTASLAAGTDDAPQYEIRYAPGTTAQFNWKKATSERVHESGNPQGGYESFTITGLAPSTAYTVGIRAGVAGSDWSRIKLAEFHTTDRNEHNPAVIEP